MTGLDDDNVVRAQTEGKCSKQRNPRSAAESDKGHIESYQIEPQNTDVALHTEWTHNEQRLEGGEYRTLRLDGGLVAGHTAKHRGVPVGDCAGRVGSHHLLVRHSLGFNHITLIHNIAAQRRREIDARCYKHYHYCRNVNKRFLQIWFHYKRLKRGLSLSCLFVELLIC